MPSICPRGVVGGTVICCTQSDRLIQRITVTVLVQSVGSNPHTQSDLWCKCPIEYAFPKPFRASWFERWTWNNAEHWRCNYDPAHAREAGF